MIDYFSPGVAIILTLVAASMWGSWMQVIKLLKKYPLSGLVFWLYTMSLIIVCLATLLLRPILLPDGIIVASAGNFTTIIQILFGGAMMSLGMLVTLKIMGDIGLLLSTTMNGAVAALLGILTAIWQEGLPEQPMAMPLIFGTTIMFVFAGFLCNSAAKMRDADRSQQSIAGEKAGQNGTVTLKTILMILLSVLLVNGWSHGTAVGTASGLPPILTALYMVIGSFVSVLIFSVIVFTKNKQWRIVLCLGESKRPLVYSGISAFCHYGGNLIAIYSMPVISATFAFLFGRSSAVWTYFWGLYYGEFSNSKRKTWIVLSLGILLFFAGVFLLGLFTLI